MFSRESKTVFFILAACSFTFACGKSGGFKNTSNTPAPEPTAQPTPVSVTTPVRSEPIEMQGYQPPDLQGQELRYLADGKARPLGEPVATEEHGVVTTIEDGTTTTIAAVKSPVTTDNKGVQCNQGIMLNSICITTQPVYKWRSETDSSLSRIVLSVENDDCLAKDNALCSFMQTNAKSNAYRTFNDVAFRSLRETDVKRPEVATSEKIKSIRICHGSLLAAGFESVMDTHSSCAAGAAGGAETFYGLKDAATGFVPVYQWNKNGFVVLTTSRDIPPAEGFTVSPDAVFYAIAAP